MRSLGNINTQITTPKVDSPIVSTPSVGRSLGNIYQDQPKAKKTLGGFIENIGKSGAELISNTASAITHPVKTAKGIYNLGAGAISKLIPGRQKSEDTFDTVANFYKNRYGKNIGETLYNDPVGVLADVATIAGGVGGTARLLGKTGAATKLVKLSSATDPLMMAGRAVKATTASLGRFFPKLVSSLPKADDLVMRGVGNPGIQKKMIVPAETIVPKYGLWDRTPESVTETIKMLNKKRQGAIREAGSTANLQDLIKPLDDAIDELRNNKLAMKSDTARGKLAEMIRRRQQILETFATQEKSGYILSTNLNPKVKLSEYDAFRREALDPDIPESAFDQALSNNKAKDAGAKVVRKSIASKVDQLSGTKELGQDLQSLYKLRDIFEGYQTRTKNRQALNFTKMGGAGLGGILSGAKGAITGFLVEQIVNSPKGLELMYKALKGVEKGAFGRRLTKTQIIANIEKELAKYNLPDVKGVANIIYNYGRAGRMINQ